MKILSCLICIVHDGEGYNHEAGDHVPVGRRQGVDVRGHPLIGVVQLPVQDQQPVKVVVLEKQLVDSL